ncbi:hypothetical protein GCM10027054_40260 [Isoptericola nanjingensis]
MTRSYRFAIPSNIDATSAGFFSRLARDMDVMLPRTAARTEARTEAAPLTVRAPVA